MTGMTFGWLSRDISCSSRLNLATISGSRRVRLLEDLDRHPAAGRVGQITRAVHDARSRRCRDRRAELEAPPDGDLQAAGRGPAGRLAQPAGLPARDDVEVPDVADRQGGHRCREVRLLAEVRDLLAGDAEFRRHLRDAAEASDLINSCHDVNYIRLLPVLPYPCQPGRLQGGCRMTSPEARSAGSTGSPAPPAYCPWLSGR